MGSTTKHKCIVCRENAPKSCGQCKAAWYCSAECQVADWAVHRLLCKSYKDFLTPPNKFSYRAILFPVNETKPKFVWKGDAKWLSNDHLEKLLEITDGTTVESNGCPENLIQNRTIKNQLFISNRSCFMGDGSKNNVCLSRLTYGMSAGSMRGNILGWRGGPGTMFNHVEFQDLRDFADWFEGRYNKVFSILTYDNLNTDGTGVAKINGVKVSCEAGVIKGNAKYTAVKVPHSHPIFATKCGGNSEKIGIPIKVLGYPVDKSLPHVPECSLNCQKHNGVDQLVVRADGNDFLPAHMEAITEFCNTKVQPLLQAQGMYKNDSLEYSNLVSEEINRVKFAEYFEKYRADKVIVDAAWAGCPTPFEIKSDEKRHRYIKALAYRGEGSS